MRAPSALHCLWLGRQTTEELFATASSISLGSGRQAERHPSFPLAVNEQPNSQEISCPCLIGSTNLDGASFTTSNCQPPEFLVECRITPIEFSQLCEALCRADHDVLGRDRQVALAVAAVHIAANAEGTSSDFGSCFFRRLGLAFDVSRWEFVFGPAIFVSCDRYFPETVSLERNRPIPLCVPIYRHSGLPGKGLAAFANVLAGAVRSHGTIFSYEQYRRTLPASLPRLVREFLKSPVGYQFTLQSARLLTRIKAGLVPRAEIGDVPGIATTFGQNCWNTSSRTRCVIPKPTKWPWLALDTDSVRLVLRFDPCTASAPRKVRHRWSDGHFVGTTASKWEAADSLIA